MAKRDVRLQALVINGVPQPRSGPASGEWYTIDEGDLTVETRGESVSVASQVTNPTVLLTIQVLSEDPGRLLLEAAIRSYRAGAPLLMSGFDGMQPWAASEAHPVGRGGKGAGASVRTMTYTFSLFGYTS